MDKNKLFTMGCVTIAGLVFIPTVIFSIPVFALIGAFFDWLPLFTGWMKTGGAANKLLIIFHTIVTIIAYGFFVVWILMKGNRLIGFTFLEIWWVAVIIGVLIIVYSKNKKSQEE